MPSILRRRLPAIGAGLLLVAGLAYAFRPQPVPVDLVPVARGPLAVTVGDEGWTRVRDLFVVSTPIAGRVLRVAVHAGDAVTAGDTVVATLQPSDPGLLDVRSRAQAQAEVHAAEAALGLAEAQLTRARAELEFARADLERARALAERSTISPRALERAELELRTQEAAVATAEADRRMRRYQLETARAMLIEPGAQPGDAAACCLPLRAPVDGRILRVLQESEAFVAAGTPIAEIGDTRDLEIVVELLSGDAVKVEEGAAVTIEGWGGPPLAGRLRRIEPFGFTKVSALGIEEQRVRTVIDLTDPPARWAALGHGYRVVVRIVVWQGEDIVKVPLGALFREGDDWAVFVEAAGRAQLRRVALGWSGELDAEIRAGLEPGERVVLHPSDRVADGSRLVARGGD